MPMPRLDSLGLRLVSTKVDDYLITCDNVELHFTIYDWLNIWGFC